MTTRRFPVPWGLFISLGIYAVGVTGYVVIRRWTSPEYAASQEYAAAWQLLGRDRGRHCSRRELEQAYEHLVRAAQQMPQVRQLHDELEELNWRFDERHWNPPANLRAAADASGAVWAHLQEQGGGPLTASLREQGWDAETLSSGPGRTLAWSAVGAVGILVVWLYLRSSARDASAQAKEEHLKQLEREAAERGAQRRTPKR